MSDSSLLEGVRVLEFGQIAAGPFTGSLLADLGGDVVKVERPGLGDGMRQWPPLTPNPDGERFSENFASLNRNKRSVALDLSDTHDLETLKVLCRQADVVVENFRPGVMERKGLGYDQLSAENPGLIFCSISGYGQTGPYASRGAFDVTIQAVSGLMSVTGEAEGGPVKCGVPVGDFCAGLYAAYSIVAALLKRGATGKGSYIDCSMMASLIGVAALQTSEYFGTGQSAGRIGSAHPRNAPYQAFRASDEYFVIAAGNDKLWREVCEAVSLAELAEDSRFETQEQRASNQKELAKILEAEFRKKPAAYWIDKMVSRGVPASPINDYADVVRNEQVQHLDLVRELLLPNGVKTRTTGFPVHISGHRFEVYRSPPQLGEHTRQVLEEWAGSAGSES